MKGQPRACSLGAGKATGMEWMTLNPSMQLVNPSIKQSW